jgi:type IV secretory pathway VirB10-like protein
VGPRAPSGSTDGLEPLYAAQVYVALGCLSIALLASTVMSPTAAAQPQPDPAPAAPAIVPDPAPGTSPAEPTPGTSPVEPAPPQQETSTRYVQPELPAPPPTEPQSTPQASSATTPKPDAAAGARSKPERQARHAAPQRAEQTQADNALPNSAVPMEWLTPRLEPADAPRHVVLLAAGALLALLMASGSLISVAARATRGQLR